MLTKRKKDKVIKENRRHDSDTGSPEVQINLLTKKIDELSSHLKKHTKDKHSRRGLLGMVADRRKHLLYLKKKNPKLFEAVSQKIKTK